MDFTIIKPEESQEIFETQLPNINHSQQALVEMIAFFENYKTKLEVEDAEEDMLLCQFGSYQLPDSKEKNFIFNLTRQYMLPHQEELLQLSLTLIYDQAALEDIASFEAWSADYAEIEDWKLAIEQTKGYLATEDITPKEIVLVLELT